MGKWSTWFSTRGHYVTNPNNTLREIPEHYHRFALFDSSLMGSKWPLFYSKVDFLVSRLWSLLKCELGTRSCTWRGNCSNGVAPKTLGLGYKYDKWLFQLDGCRRRKRLFHQTSILNWLFGVPGTDIYSIFAGVGLFLFSYFLHVIVGTLVRNPLVLQNCCVPNYTVKSSRALIEETVNALRLTMGS